ncbi:lipid-binding SYLF domain-containing protein [Campylobacter sp. RM13119]|uniref:Lipid-binding SYLF domain-containing protein n=1 Tax=Campylobacter californiensis TaxID=1032243 RepID=A0ABD4JIN5_9BACT|nr:MULTISPECIES: lipid-binding SYLF domain-containing protein [unclassified Campylobacter]MBE2985052.1 lipid-binding SYLF domain-containing protein [Campylobacter sp. RM6883]MBE2986613.1 lipid-binding SYLF domain-containing protein [Campylobacter sp. RM12919]MBE2987592.1 lipid-binding SYLF domain-containing protein [Campylobacter sp. RM12920]MBE2995623.1 lipid-binding SYLF domain-containing protein [Campylobacter sp. RM6913]MBE3606949.1 lipid-binding SYLF domain-containing protein [Campylobact
MRKILLMLAFFATILSADIVQNQKVKRAINVLNDFIIENKDQNLLKDASAIAIFTDLTKGGAGVSVINGKGIFVAKNDDGQISSPFFVDFSGIELGATLGLSSVDLIIVYKNSRSYHKIFENNYRISLSTQATMINNASGGAITTNAPEFFAYARESSNSRGIYLGVGIQISHMGINRQDTIDYYDRIYDYEDIYNNSPKASKYTKKLQELARQSFKG